MIKNKKLLLIKPSYEHTPIGMAYVMGVLQKEGISFDFHDMNLNRNKCIQDVINNEDYFCVATGGLVGDFHDICKIIWESKKTNPNIPVILGGGITNDVVPDLLFKTMPVDYAVRGEAETALPGLLKVLLGKDHNIHACCGLMFKDKTSGQIVKTTLKMLDLDNHDPLPLYKYVDMEHYINNWNHPTFGKIRAMPILTGRGCRGRCSFCSPTLGRFRKRKYDDVFAEIEEYNQRYKPEAFMFINEILYQTTEEIIEFCKQYRKLSDSKPWMCLLRADIDPTVFPFMRDSGCFGINIGIESGSDKILKSMRKGVDKAQVLNVIRALKKTDFVIEFSFMLANEGETEEDMKSTIDLLIEEEIVYHTIGLTSAYPGTKIYRNALKRGQRGNRSFFDHKRAQHLNNYPHLINKHNYSHNTELLLGLTGREKYSTFFRTYPAMATPWVYYRLSEIKT